LGISEIPVVMWEGYYEHEAGFEEAKKSMREMNHT
jgi:hypothetical protein